MEVKYPILLIRENDKFLYGMTSNLGVVSKGGESFYTKRKITIYDSNGNVFQLTNPKLDRTANWRTSLRYFQQMYEMDFQLEKKTIISLTELKDIVLNHMRKHLKHWSTRDPFEVLEEMVTSEKDFSGLFKKLR